MALEHRNMPQHIGPLDLDVNCLQAHIAAMVAFGFTNFVGTNGVFVKNGCNTTSS